MRLFKVQGTSDVFWPLENNNTSGATAANSDSEAVESSDDVVLDLGMSQKSTV